MELCDKTFNVEGSIELLVLKIIIWKKQPLQVNDFFNSDQLEHS